MGPEQPRQDHLPTRAVKRSSLAGSCPGLSMSRPSGAPVLRGRWAWPNATTLSEVVLEAGRRVGDPDREGGAVATLPGESGWYGVVA